MIYVRKRDGEVFWMKCCPMRFVLCFTFLAVLFWSVYIVEMVTSSQLDANKINSYFNSRINTIINKGYRLKSVVLEPFHVASLAECIIHCGQRQCCRSLNYKTDSFDNESNCELLHAVVSEELRNVKKRALYDNYQLTEPVRPYNCSCFCKNMGTCQGEFETCTCLPGFSGDRCAKAVDECQNDPCHQKATCTNTMGSFRCRCNDGFTGDGSICTVRSCKELYNDGEVMDGIYSIDPDGQGAFDVRCDMTTDGGGWTVFQRRIDGSVDFYRKWTDYKNGFGNMDGEFWLGLDKIHRITYSEEQSLRIDLEDFQTNTRYAKYSKFRVANEDAQYNLDVSGYSGDAGDSLAPHHNGMKFTTKDRDNDGKPDANCAKERCGAWWYNWCHTSNLNGFYYHTGGVRWGQGLQWWKWKGQSYSLKMLELKLRSN